MENLSEKIVVSLGGAGYIGECVSNELIKLGITPIVFDSLMFEDSYKKDGLILIREDIRDDKKLKYWLDRADAVINLAGHVGDQSCTISPEISAEINTERVEFIAKNYNKRICFLSTCSTYGVGDEILTEESPTNPLSLYAQSKLIAESKLKDKNAIIYRLGTAFGAEKGSYARLRFDLVLNLFCAKAFHEKKLSIFGGSQFRPLIHHAEIAKNVVANLFSEKTGIYNLAYGNYTILEIAQMVQKHFPDTVLEITPIKTEDARNYRVSCEKARRELNFDPIISPEQGIQEFVWLFDQKRVKNWKDPRYYCWDFMKEKSPHLDDLYPPKVHLIEEVKNIKLSSVV